MVATGFSYEPERRARQAELLLEVLPRVRDIRRAGAAALDLSYLAAGRVDAYYERGLNAWDWAAGRLIVEEAGGVVADLDGDPHGLVGAATPELQVALLERWCAEAAAPRPEPQGLSRYSVSASTCASVSRPS